MLCIRNLWSHCSECLYIGGPHCVPCSYWQLCSCKEGKDRGTSSYSHTYPDRWIYCNQRLCLHDWLKTGKQCLFYDPYMAVSCCYLHIVKECNVWQLITNTVICVTKFGRKWQIFFTKLLTDLPQILGSFETIPIYIFLSKLEAVSCNHAK